MKMFFKAYLRLKPICWFTKTYSARNESKRQLLAFAEALMKNHEYDFQRKIKTVDRKPQLVLDQLYLIRDTMTFEQAIYSTYTMLFGGFDTSGTAISIVLLLLAMHQDEQEKVFQSLVGDLSEEDLCDLKYLEMAIKESLRLIPIALALGRVAKEHVELSGVIDNVCF